jgi:eukaryotic-like serine/threonine-protein kinase
LQQTIYFHEVGKYMSLEGQQIGRYHLIRLLGSGGMGDVYLAENQRIDQYVAIKIIRSEIAPYPDAQTTKEATRLLEREAKAIAQLDHPHILGLFDFGEATINDIPFTYIVMPYRKEGSLASWLNRRDNTELLPVGDVIHFLQQAADALQHAHDHGIIHQDVKPSNFLIRTRDDQPQHPDLLLADFGIAKMASATASNSQSVHGTPAYMAPEQWQGTPVPATDQYALAIMAYQLLTGQPPFQGRLEQVMHQHFTSTPTAPSILNPKLSPALDSVLLRALAKNPQERFPSISAFAKQLQQVQPTGPIAKTVPPTSPDPSSDDLHATLTITESEALSGTQRTLTLPNGLKVMVAIPANSQAGQVIHFQMTDPSPNSTNNTYALNLTLAIKQEEGSTLNPKTTPVEQQIPSESLYKQAMPASFYSLTTSDTIAPDKYFGGTSTPPPPPPPRKSPSLSKSNIALLLLLTISLIAASGIFDYLSLARINTLTTTKFLAHSTAYVKTISTAYAKTATSVVQATASVTFNPYPIGKGPLLLYDPLSNNLGGYGWHEGNDNQGGSDSCHFINNTLQVSAGDQGKTEYCPVKQSFNSFLFEVQMSLIYGDAGGILLSLDSTQPSYYLFMVSQDGTYNLIYTSKTMTIPIITGNAKTIFKTGFSQSNRLAVAEQGRTINLYINGKLINSAVDCLTQSGPVGVAVSENVQATKATFSNAKLWAL